MSTAAPATHPRIRARRIAVLRGAGRRRLRRLAIGGGAAAVAVALAGLTQTALLDVDRVEVRGAAHSDQAAVLAAAGIDRGDALVGLDLGAAERAVARLPWVAEADVGRSLAGEITIEIVERTPAAAFTQVDGVALVDANGRVLEVGSTPPDQLPTITGVEDALTPGATVPREATGALALAQRLAAELPGRIESVAVGPELTAAVRGGGLVRFGSATDLDAKMLAVTTVLREVDSTCLATLDVRLPGNPVLTRAEPCR